MIEQTLTRMIGGTCTSSSASLALSLIFGAGQLVAGGAIAFRLLARSQWRRLNLFALVLIALWFAASGVTELFVSGMETSHDVRGVPSAATFSLWRERADTVLVAITAVLGILFAVALAVHRFRKLRRVRHASGDDVSR